jgi:glycosyltransferase involved in cell wall biosynthesis
MAGRLALEHRSPLVAYSYYATEAFRMMEGSGLPRILFQVHPHGAFLREIYRREIETVPAAAASLKDEAEMSAGFDANDEAVRLADAVICTSSFTQRSLLAAGCKAPIEVIPYGVDLTAFSPRTSAPSVGPLRVAFVGTLSQRKGATHLMKALSGLGPGRATLVLCARSAPDPILLRGAEGVVIEHRRGLADGALAEVIKGCDLLVLPSIAEGFGLVILEAMACGVPVLCTDATGGADIITHGHDGWVVPAGAAAPLSAVFQRASGERGRLLEMGIRARSRAESLGWSAYRRQVAEAYLKHAA